MLKRTILLLFITSNLFALEVERKQQETILQASYYSNKFQGKKTSSGQIFDQNKYTAACNRFPLNSKLQVTRIIRDDTYKVEVIVNDRTHPNYSHRIDLSRKAASDLHLLQDGIGEVKIQQL